jgi:hypothetical protein
MDGPFGYGQGTKDGYGVLFNFCRERARFNHFPNIGETSMMMSGMGPVIDPIMETLQVRGMFLVLQFLTMGNPMMGSMFVRGF